LRRDLLTVGWALDEFDFVTLRCVNECDSAARAGKGGAVRKRKAEFLGMGCKCSEVIDLKCEVCQIGADDDRARSVVLADFDKFIALRCFKEYQLGPARRPVV
jgi:hypothetical protein